MQTLTLRATVRNIETVEIPFPAFFRSKDESKYIAILDEETCIKWTLINEYVSMQKGKPETFDLDIVEAWRTFHSCTEMEFLEKYDSVIDSLHPALKA